jgi:hypothetical protein
MADYSMFYLHDLILLFPGAQAVPKSAFNPIKYR